MLSAVMSLTALGLVLGFALGYAAKFFKVESSPIVEEVEKMMPGSQCGQCGFPGCRAAAEAIANGVASVNICPPGGKALAEQLAEKLNVVIDLSGMKPQAPKIARVSEATCIGCARCAKKCPTDAIIGAQKQIHVVIRDACIGCGACVAVCPTECLQLHPVAVTIKSWKWVKPDAPLLA
jgi:Na+-translocating ferredoxin:NAD+ oxidoreductase subunit B